MTTLGHDLRHAARLFRRTPAFTLTAILGVALGVGGNTAIFSLARTLLSRPLPGVDAPGVYHITAAGEHGGFDGIFSYDDYRLLQDRSATLEIAAHYSTAPLAEVTAEGRREVQGAVVSAGYFPMLGVQPERGRFFTPEEDRLRGGAPVAVIGHTLWQERYSGSPAAIGATLRLNGTTFTIVGIAPSAFEGALQSWHNDVWLPLSMLGTAYRFCDPFQPDCNTLNLLGKLRPGSTRSQADAELASLSPALQSIADPDQTMTASLGALGGLRPGPGREGWKSQLLLLFLAGGLVVLVACANLAGSLLSAGVARRREFVIRMALGARPGRIRRQLITECLFLAVLGGGLGIVVALWTQRALNGMYAVDSEGYATTLGLRLDPVVAAFALVLAVLLGIGFALLPAIRASRAGLRLSRADPQTPGARRGLGSLGLLAGIQVAVSFAALVGATLLVQSAATVHHGGGFDPSGIALFRVRPRLAEYDPSRAQAYTREVIRQLEATPGVRGVTGAGIGAAWGPGDEVSIWHPDAPPSDAIRAPRARTNEILPHYFETLGVTIVAGRDFENRDDADAEPVAIVDQNLARRYWPGSSALGQVLVVDGVERRVVGIALNPYLANAGTPTLPSVWTPYWQDPDRIDARFAVRVEGDPAVRLGDLVRTVRGVDPNVLVTEALTMETQIGAAFRSVRTIGMAVGFAALLAIVLAGLGLYGILGFAVNAQRRSIAVRKALGAAPADVVKNVTGKVAAVVLGGTALGIVLSLIASRGLAHLVYGVSPWDPRSFVGSAAALFLVTVLACTPPTRRALRIEPREALTE